MNPATVARLQARSNVQMARAKAGQRPKMRPDGPMKERVYSIHIPKKYSTN